MAVRVGERLLPGWFRAREVETTPVPTAPPKSQTIDKKRGQAFFWIPWIGGIAIISAACSTFWPVKDIYRGPSQSVISTLTSLPLTPTPEPRPTLIPTVVPTSRPGYRSGTPILPPSYRH